ncbi:MAG TPA: beta/gamma crystallin-related protein [Casimicrobiaceae bacterium]|nr:beta/gamma crystallin-related protein [Casimicrobiaceae bacterium]
MNRTLRNLLLAAGLLFAGQALADIQLYSDYGFNGNTFRADRTTWNLDRLGFNDQAHSAVVRGGSWEVCTDARFQGRCVVLRPGDYSDLDSLGLGGNISSMREVNHYGDERAYRRDYDRGYSRGYRDDNRYEYRNDGWRYDRYEGRWERY